MAKHAPLYYATYKGPEPIVFIGEGPEQRGYPAGQTIQVGKPDADRIRKSEHDFDLERVSTEIIGTAEERQPTHPGAVHDLNLKLLERD